MFRIVWQPIALEEYEQNLIYWINHNKSNDYSLKIMQSVERMEDLLAFNPYIGKRTLMDKDIFRISILRNFYIYYKIKGNVLNIIAFKGTSQGITNTFGL